MWEHLEEFLKDRERRGVRQATLCSYRRQLDAARRGTTSTNPYTLATLARVTRIYLRWCIATGKLPPDTELPPQRKTPPCAPKAISDDDFDALCAAARNAKERALLFLLRDTGARIGAICRLRWANLDLARHRALVEEKGGRAQILRLTERDVIAIRQLPRDHDTVLGLSVWGAISTLRRLKQRAGVKGRCNAHAFRHAYARDLLRAGLDLSRVSQLMGHADVSTTARYYALWASDELDLAYRTYWEMRYAVGPKSMSSSTDPESTHDGDDTRDVVIIDQHFSAVSAGAQHASLSPARNGHSRQLVSSSCGVDADPLSTVADRARDGDVVPRNGQRVRHRRR